MLVGAGRNRRKKRLWPSAEAPLASRAKNVGLGKGRAGEKNFGPHTNGSRKFDETGRT